MSRIQLKPNSAEYDDGEDRAKTQTRLCDMPHCAGHAEHKAPKDRSLADYYWFCFQHVQEYNKAWDFFSGMSAAEIEDHLIRSALWDRPTQKFSKFSGSREELYRQAWRTYNFTEDEPPREKTQRRTLSETDTPEVQAMAVMGLEPPLDIKVIKTRYKELAKKYHPDVNKGDKESEETLKSINMAYTVLKIAYDKFEKLPQE